MLVVGLPEDAGGIVLGYLATPEDPRLALGIAATSHDVARLVSGLLTHVNTDLVAYPRALRLLRPYARQRARLTNVTLRANYVESQLFLFWLLAHCDVSNLSVLRLYPETYMGMQQTLSEADPGYSVHYIDLTTNETVNNGTKGDFERLRGTSRRLDGA